MHRSSKPFAVRALLSRLLATLLIAVAATAARADIAGMIDAQTSSLRITYHGAPIVTGSLSFWRGPNWTYSNPPLLNEVVENGARYRLSGQDATTLFSLGGQIERPQPGTLVLDLLAEEGATGAVDLFGGFTFNIELSALGRPGVQPILLADRTGWSLQIDPARPPMTVKFDRPLSWLAFEANNPGEIRGYFLARNEVRDSARIRMTVDIPGTFGPSAAERLVPKSATWPTSDLHWNRSPVDLSFLNAPEIPAGKRGFLRADGERLVFQDGTPVRFWGTNISAYALFQYKSRDTIKAQAKRLSQLGFNLVRLHHHDSSWVSPNVFGKDAQQTRELSKDALDRLDWWIKCLKDEGIYIWLDLHVGRELFESDSVTAFAEMAKGSRRAKMFGYLYINPSLQHRMWEFVTAYIDRVNPHTGLAIKDDPAIVAALITNENDLTSHFGNALLPNANVPWHSARYMQLARAFASRHGLDPDRTWRSWEPGPSKLFLADLEHRYFSETTASLRALGFRAPVIGTNTWGRMDLSGLTSLSMGDMVDVHVYGRSNEISSSPRFYASASSWIGAAAVAGKPLSVSEWNVERFPFHDRFILPLHIAALSRLQGWAALMQFAYTQAPLLGPAAPGPWEAIADPALLAVLPASALMFRAGHVAEGRQTVYLDFPRNVLIDRRTSPETSRALRTLVERSRMRVGIPPIRELPWLKPTSPPPGVQVITDPDHDAVGDKVSRICSDTGEICRDWGAGTLTIDTPRTQLAAGWIGGQTMRLRDVTIVVGEASSAVAVQSLDEAPIRTAGSIMISMTAQALPMVPGRMPFQSEPVTGEIRIRARPGLGLYRLDGVGAAHRQSFTVEDGVYTISLSPARHGHWWVMR
jgi:hypothetical protein